MASKVLCVFGHCNGITQGNDGFFYYCTSKTKQVPLKKKDGFKGQQAIVLPRPLLAKLCAKHPLIGNLYITDMGYYPKAQFHYRQRLKGAEQHIIIHCIEGKGTVQVAGKKYLVNGGDFIAIPAHTPHEYEADKNNSWTIQWLHFKGTAADALIQRLVQQLNGYVGFAEASNTRDTLFRNIYTYLEKGYSKDNLVYVNMCCWYYLSSFLFSDRFDPPQLKDQQPGAVALSISFMQDHLYEVLTLQQMAGAANLSTSHFSFVFRKQTGFSPIEYFNHLKVQKACQYLLFSNMLIKEIAFALGIEDQYYFSRMFTRVMGLSPNDYREKRIH